MKYLVTGGAGFIGSSLVKLLEQNSHEVVVMDSLVSGNKDNLAGTSARLMPFDIANYESFIAEAREVDYIIHLAASIGVHNTMDNCPKIIHNNVNNADMVFRTASSFNKPVFFASTSEVYGKNMAVPFTEDTDSIFGTPTSPRWAYAQSKALGESLASHYAKNNGLKFITGRIFNTVGPNQNTEYGMVLPRFIKQATSGQDISIYGSGLQTRSFCHVEDTAAAIYALTQSGRFGETYNIGGNEETSILSLADQVIKITRSMSGVQFIDYDIAYGKGFEDVSRRVPDITKINTHIGWKPTKTIDEIIGEML